MIEQRALSRIDGLIEKCQAVIGSARPNPPNVSSSYIWVDADKFSEWRNQSLSFLNNLVGQKSPYALDFAERCKQGHLAEVRYGLGILRGVREDIQAGNLASFSELVHADVFSDFLEMAEYLMSEDHGYKDAAAVLGGGVLEEHIRKLCEKNDIEIRTTDANGDRPKKADRMNADLAAADVYNKNEQKIVTAWLGIRNSAAHGKYGEYTKPEVALMLSGLRDFIARNPA